MKERSYEYKLEVGQRHGRLVAISKIDGYRTRWLCQCDCGKTVIYNACFFLKLKSCGCLNAENRIRNMQKRKSHGCAETKLYSKWSAMKNRCYNPNFYCYHTYGGRGIKVCDEWKNSFQNFQKWALENGYDEEKNGRDQSLDRIDVNGDYCPENCRFVTMHEQSLNTTRSRYLEYKGNKYNVATFAKEIGCYGRFVTRCLDKGLNGDEIAITWREKHPKTA